MCSDWWSFNKILDLKFKNAEVRGSREEMDSYWADTDTDF